MTEEPYKLIERHTSPDGVLDFVVFHRHEDWIVGFVEPGTDATKSQPGWPWHTHGRFLMENYGGSPEAATRAFVGEVLSSKRVIVISRYDGVIRHACVTNDPDDDEMNHAPPNKTVEKRYWNGLRYAGAGNG